MSRDSREETRPDETRQGEGRKKRIPLGTPRQRLSRAKRAGFKRRWNNDTPGRIQHALEGGYEHVLRQDTGEKDKEVVGTKQDGSPLTGYLMEIPQKFFDEDQKIKQAEIDKVDETIQRGNIRGADPGDTDRYYVPSEGISVKTD